MVLSGGLFASGVAWIALSASPPGAQATSWTSRPGLHTLRRVDRLQPALLVVCLGSTIGFAASAGGAARALAALAAGGLLVVLVGSVAWLVPVQRRLIPGHRPQGYSAHPKAGGAREPRVGDELVVRSRLYPVRALAAGTAEEVGRWQTRQRKRRSRPTARSRAEAVGAAAGHLDEQDHTQDSVYGPGVPVTATETFRWLDGGYFLVQEYETTFGEEPTNEA